MYREHTVGVVVPAYNEEGYVGRTIDTMPEYVDRVYVVDDASTDDTWAEIIERAEAANRSARPEAPGFDVRVVPIQHEENRGVGGAIKTGYLRARDDRIDVTAVMGGDNQMNPAELHRYLDPIVEGKADYTKGSRFLRGEDWADMPRFRLLGNVMLSYLTKVASGYWTVMDPQNGYTAISLSALERVSIEEMYEYYGYCNDLMVKLNVENLRVADVPRSSTFAYEDGWQSHVDLGEYVPRVSAMLLRNFLWRLRRKYLIRDFHPLALFYSLGTAIAGAGVVKAVASLRRSNGEATPDGGRRRTSSLTWLIVGVILLLHAAVLDAEDNRDLDATVLNRDRRGLDRGTTEPAEEHERVVDGSVAADGGTDP